MSPEAVAHALRRCGAGPVVAIESLAQVAEKLAAVGLHAGADGVKRGQRQAQRIFSGLQHQRRHGAHQHGARQALGAVAADVARHFAAARGMTDQGGARQVQRGYQGGQVIGIGIHVVAVERLAGAAMAAPVVRDDAIAVRGQIKHLVFPGVGRQRPAVAEDDGRAAAPVLVINQGAVGGTQGIV